MFKHRRGNREEAELDITSFMNLMIILVPVLLMNMVFTQITVLELTLPGLSSDQLPDNLDENTKLEVVVREDFIDVNFPEGIRLQRINKVEIASEQNAALVADQPPVADESLANQDLAAQDYDFALLSNVLQEVKRLLKSKDIEKRDILLLSEPETDYQTIIRVMDTVRSFKTVQVTSVVDAELFPDISMGDAPVSNSEAE